MIPHYNDTTFPPDFNYTMGWPDDWHEYHAASTVEFGELVECGWIDLSNKAEWPWSLYSEEQDDNLRKKITNHFWNREIGIVPPGLWKRQFLEKMEEIMPKYILFYKVLDEDGAIPGHFNEWYKSRNIFSDFPQTQLSGNSDYASTGNDTEYEKIRRDDVIDTIERLNDFNDVDYLIIKELEELFSCLVSVSFNSR